MLLFICQLWESKKYSQKIELICLSELRDVVSLSLGYFVSGNFGLQTLAWFLFYQVYCFNYAFTLPLSVLLIIQVYYPLFDIYSIYLLFLRLHSEKSN